jgi:membrane-associated phospholipid phosphatase
MTREQLSWARLVSNLLSPPVIWAVMAFPIAFRDAETQTQALTWALVYGVLVCLLPLLYVVWMVRRGAISDLHMEVRQQRLRPFVVSLVCTTIAWWVLRFMGAPAVLPLFALFSLAQIAVIALITLVWQISMHAMSISGAVVAAFAFFGLLPALLLLPLVVLVGAARLKLQRHTPAQVVAGAAVGVVVPLLLFILIERAPFHLLVYAGS